MPRLTQTGKFHADTDEVVLGFSFDSYLGVDGSSSAQAFEGAACTRVYVRVRGSRFTKHVHWLDDDSIIVAKGKAHTAIQPKSITYMGALYEGFARDLAREFFAQGSGPVWVELAYRPQELHTPLIGIDVKAGGAAMPNYTEVVVGANIVNVDASLVRQSPLRDPRTGALTVVSINHGPYAR